MAGLDNVALVQRFLKLPLEQRKAFLDKLASKGMSLGQLPIPANCACVERPEASYAQQRQWFLWHLEPDSAAYHMPVALRLRGPLDLPALERSFSALLERHPTLRSRFEQHDEQLLQVVMPATALTIGQVHIARAEHAAPVEAQIERFIEEHCAEPFDLATGPLLRVRLLHLGEQEELLLIVMHHIVSDGWSMALMVDELMALYAGFASQTPVSLPALAIQYGDYALWQRRWMEAGERDRQLDYWLHQLGREQVLLELPTDYPRPAQQSLRGARVDLQLPLAQVQAVRKLAQAHNGTPFMVLLAAFQALLHRYTGQGDIRVGVPIANRQRSETAGLIGFFVNTQVMRAQLDGRMSFDDLLRQVRETSAGAQAHQDLPFEHLVEALQPERNLSHGALFQVLHSHRQQTPRAATQALGLSVEPHVLQTRTSKFDLTLETLEHADGISASLIYACDLFSAATAQRMAGHWSELLQSMLDNPAGRISEVCLGDLAERQTQQALCQGQPLMPRQPSVLGLFREQVARYPQRLALVAGDAQLSFAELDRLSDVQAQHLLAAGVVPEQVVAIAAPRSAGWLVALLAVLKSGGTYVSLDLDTPIERQRQLLEDSRARILLDQGSALASLDHGLTVLAMGAAAHDPLHAKPLPQGQGDAAAYVVFTSGSSGRPKGVVVSHGALLNYVEGMLARIDLEGVERMAMVSTVAADLGYTLLFGALCSGRTLHLLDRERVTDAQAFARYMDEQRIDALKIVPSHLEALLKVEDPVRCLPQRCLVLGGEACSDGLMTELARLAPALQVYNHYGPTETTVGVLAGRLQLGGRGTAVLGQALANSQLYVLDAGLTAQPFGVIGELYIAGAGLARGYLGQAGLTAERFVPDPFAADGRRMYRSGDQVRLGDAGLEYRGRVDDQVKIRGYRVEPGEIAIALRQLPGVAEALVLARQVRSTRQLVAYVVPEQAGATSEQQLKSDLHKRLPDYMVPAHLVLLDALPLNANGKVDRASLPEPTLATRQADWQAPLGAMEQGIAQLWASLLKVERVGRQDNFFELGGDSIVSIQLVSRARQAGMRFTAKQLFQHQTVQGLASVALWDAPGSVGEQGAVTGSAPLLPIQQAFFDAEHCEPHHWNQSVLLQPLQRLDATVLGQALEALIAQHDALRLRFSSTHEGWQASFSQAAPSAVLWQAEVADATALEALAQQAQRSLDTAQGPLLRAVLASLADGQQRLLLVIHHLVVDGVSWRILFEDLQQAYQQLARGAEVRLPSKTSSVRQWGERLLVEAGNPARVSELAFWQAQLAGAHDQLPCRNPAGSRQNRVLRHVGSQLEQAATRQLLQQAPAAYRTQVNDLLLTALARALQAWSGHPGALVQLEGHGREALFDDIDLTRTVGWFTCKYPVHLRAHGGLGDCIKAIKEQLRAIPDKGVGFGILRYLGERSVREALAALPAPRITFNYLGQFDSSFDAQDTQALLRPAPESAGDEQSPLAVMGNWLTLTGQVYDGCLSLAWSYSGEVFEDAAVQQLADIYLAELQGVIDHCLSAGAGGPTPSDFPLARLAQAQLDKLPVDVRAIDDLYPLAPMQQGMLFHTLYARDGGDYINQLRVDVEGLVPERFRAAWQRCMDEHEILRTGFIWEGELDAPLQVVMRGVQVPFEVRDLRGLADLPRQLEAIAAEQLALGFELGQAPLLRLLLVRTEDERYHLVYTHHHILMDGWSSSQLLGEVLQHYRGQAPASRVGRYRDYIRWLQSQDQAADQAFWTDQLQRLDEPTRLADAVIRPTAPGQGQGAWHLAIDSHITRQLGEFARQQKVTLNTLVQAAWLLLLQRYTGKRSVCFGATVAGRPAHLAGIERQVGLFINTLPVVAEPCSEQPVGEWLQQVQNLNLAVREHEHTPLFEIQRWAGQGGAGLFDTLLIFENYPVSEALADAEQNDLRFGAVRSHEQTNYPLALLVGLGDSLSLEFSFARTHFADATIKQMATHLRALLCGMLAGAQRPLAELELLERDERQALLQRYNATACEHDLELDIARRFEAQVQVRGDALAVVFADQHLSYAELDRRANQLAHALVGRGVGPDVAVGIAVERSLDMIIGLLAVLKAGGAYIPLDPAYPQDRLAHMIEDSGMHLLLTQRHLHERLPMPSGMQVMLLDDAEQRYAGQSCSRPAVKVAPQHLAYVIYTSGSTGKPKGVMVPHGALVNFALSMAARPGLVEGERMLSLTTFSFDIFGLELYVPLLVGACVVMAEKATTQDPQAALALIEHANIDVLQATPSTWRMLVDDVRADVLRGRRLLCGGEALAEELAQRMLALDTQVWNLYGPTETTIWSALQQLTTDAPKPWLGGPIDNTRLFLLDGQLQANPCGVAGELLIGGHGLARGYLNRPSLTAERFVPDPFGNGGERLYRTGDLARHRPDGVIEYLGRIDHQVKIRGHRIELGEIEARLLEHAEVREAAVLAQDGPGGAQLVAYMVPANSAWLGEPAARQLERRDLLRAWLREALPEFMVPAHLLMLERFPRTPNGKLDRKALPSVEQGQLRKAYRAPQEPVGQDLARIWSAVLQVRQVGLDDNFFDLGGHSLLATQVVVRVRNELRVDVPLRVLFESADLAAFAEQVQALRQGAASVDEELAKSLEALKRLSSVELEKLISE
ncbi:amino acid adenylation domain-containing protein [Pseudomonas sp. NY15463]|uniref:amino acid adenylation domain-containing protein n=1 Tax=Pseudomonas sp. NY15463 TaxID=3400361 RepID=UPI003A8B6329